jgi:molybdate transport system regulatory protein
MNILHGEITELVSEGELSLVKVLAYGQLFHSIVIDTPDSSPYLTKGHPVRLLFKETEVIIATTDPLSVSVRNQLRCRVKKITVGKLLCELTLSWTPAPCLAADSSSSASGTAAPAAGIPLATNNLAVAPDIRSVITRNACEQLDLKENDPVIALIKTNEVSLSPHD